MLKWLLKSLLILAVFVPFAAALPLASVSLCRTPDGAQFLFWSGPWSCCFWVLIYSQLSAAPWRQGRDAVHRWREANGGLLHTSIIACGWMTKGGGKRKRPVKVRRMTPDLLSQLIAIHSQCVYDQHGKCALTVFAAPLCWEINKAIGVGNEEDNAFRRVDPMCAAKPLGEEWFDTREDK